jgi:hypothetical protein
MVCLPSHKIKLYKFVASAAMEVCTHALLALPFLAIQKLVIRLLRLHVVLQLGNKIK